MSRLRQLKETRNSKREALKPIADKIRNGGSLSDDEARTFEGAEVELRNIDRDIRAAEMLLDEERTAPAEPLNSHSRELRGLASRYSIGKAIQEFGEHGRLTGIEAEWQAENRSGRQGAITMPTTAFLGERRALTTTAPAAGPGGNLVATEQGAMIDRLRPRLLVETLGATVLSDLQGNLDLPRHKESGSASWVSEHAAGNRTDAQFDKVSMGPKTVTAEYELSRRMLLQAPQVEPLLRQDIGWLLAQALDRAAIRGGGTDEPIGIMETAGMPVHALGTNGGDLVIDTAIDMMALPDAADAMEGRSFLTNTAVKAKAMKLRDAENRLYGLPAVFGNEPVAFSNQVPRNLTKGTGTNLSAILYGYWPDLVIGYWSNVDILLNPYHSDVASKGGSLMHAFLDADIALRHVQSFVVCKDVK